MGSKPMASEYTLTYTDYSGEKSPAKITGASPVQAGFDTWTSLMAAIKSAIANITLGELYRESQASYVNIVSNDTPSNAFAQRELKWLVTYRGNTSEKLFRVELPCADAAAHLLPASDLADLTETDMAAFVTAFEAFAKSPDNGTESVSVQSIRLVGRNI